MNFAKLLFVCFLSLTVFEQCDKKQRNTNDTTASSGGTGLLSPTPTPVNTDFPIHVWYQSLMPSTPARVHELPFRLPDAKPNEVFDSSFIRFVATDKPLGGHPNNDIGDAARQVLRDFTKGFGSDDLYYNGLEQIGEDGGKDIIGDVAAMQALAKRERAAAHWVRNRFQLGIAIGKSVGHQWRVSPPMPDLHLPDTMTKYVQAEFESLRNGLSQEQRVRLAGWQTSIGSPPSPSVGESLWLKQNSNVIWISPFLIRGMLLHSVQDPAEREYKRALADNTFSTRLLDNPEVLKAVNFKFRTAIRYLLAHGIQHVTLTPSPIPGSDKETEFDKAAFIQLGSKDTGAFLEFLEQAEANDVGSPTWGVEASGDAGRVLARIKALQ